MFTFNKIYLHSKHYFTSSNCISMQLQGIVCHNFKEMIYLLTIREINSFKEHIFIHKNVQSIEAIIFFSRNYIHFKELISSFKEMYPHSRKTYSFREIVSIQGNILI